MEEGVACENSLLASPTTPSEPPSARGLVAFSAWAWEFAASDPSKDLHQHSAGAHGSNRFSGQHDGDARAWETRPCNCGYDCGMCLRVIFARLLGEHLAKATYAEPRYDIRTQRVSTPKSLPQGFSLQPFILACVWQQHLAKQHHVVGRSGHGASRFA